MSGAFPSRFARLFPIPTRWVDQGPHGNVNNVRYYFDAVVNEHPIREAGLDATKTGRISLAAEIKCRFLKQISFP